MNWYQNAFYLLHLDHHTRQGDEVGRDADPDETARLLALSQPDVIQIHTKGNPGWTTYPSQIGHTPPQLKRDVIQVWSDIARRQNSTFSAYYNLGRDVVIMQTRPEWNRHRADGTLADRALCYNSGVAEGYLWPQIEEILAKYRPGGFWFDGSCFTVEVCYCSKCHAKFVRETGMQPPLDATQAGWDRWKEMHRQIYRDFVVETRRRIRQSDPNCLVCVNFAYSLLMPEAVPDGGPDYLSGDRANEVEVLPGEVRWYDGQNRPFDFMTTVWHQSEEGQKPKAREQMEQEMAIIIANGAKFFAWNNPNKQSGLSAERMAFCGEVIAPFLRARQSWCQNTARVPTVSRFYSSRDHEATFRAMPLCFRRPYFTFFEELERLQSHGLDYEFVSDARLGADDVRSPVLIYQPVAPPAPATLSALRRHAEKGGALLISLAALTDSEKLPLDFAALIGPPDAEDRLTRREVGRGAIWTTRRLPGDLSGEEWARITPLQSRPWTSDAPSHVELTVRRKTDTSAHILHLVNRGAGTREFRPEEKAGFGQTRLSTRITDIAPVESFNVSVALPAAPARVSLEPDGRELEWRFDAGRCEVRVPGLEIHTMLVFHAA